MSARTDLTAFVLVGLVDGAWHVWPHFWTPETGLQARAKRDRAPYDLWVQQGLMTAVPGAVIDYEWLAKDIQRICDGLDIQAIAYDRWRINLLQKELTDIGCDLPLVEHGQGYKDMSVSIEAAEEALLNHQLAHGMHPVLTMCMANATTVKDPTNARKLDKQKSTGRIDGAVALVMALGTAARAEQEQFAEVSFI